MLVYLVVLNKAISYIQSSRLYFPKITLPVYVYPSPHYLLVMSLTLLFGGWGGHGSVFTLLES